MRKTILVVMALLATACATVDIPQPPMTTAKAAGLCAEMKAYEPRDTSSSCGDDRPRNNRYLSANLFKWGGKSYMLVNSGNELEMWSLTNPNQPQMQSASHMSPGNQGDSDYDLMAFAVCDDCRYGAAWYKMGTVLFEFTTMGGKPKFSTNVYYSGATVTYGGVTFMHEGSQYLVTASGVTSDCSSTAAMYRYQSLHSLEFIQCVVAGDRSLLPSGGIAHDGYVYIGEASTRVYQFKIAPFTYTGNIFRAYIGRGEAFSIDRERDLLAEVSSLKASLWDLSNPASPTVVSTIAGNYQKADLSYPWLFLLTANAREYVYDISRPSAPVLTADSFWDPAQVWNYPDDRSGCTATKDGMWAGNTLHLPRYGRWQIADFGGCAPDLSPPSSIFADDFESGGWSEWSNHMP